MLLPHALLAGLCAYVAHTAATGSHVTLIPTTDVLGHNSTTAGHSLFISLSLAHDTERWEQVVESAPLPGPGGARGARLDHPVRVTVTRQPTHAIIPFAFARGLHNAYELYHYDVACAVARGVGPCFDAPEAPFVLCCVGGPRGWGQHCLRRDPVATRAAYVMRQPYLVQQVQVHVSYGARSRTVALSSRRRSDVGDGIRVVLDDAHVRPPHDLLPLAQQWLLLRDLDPRAPDPWRFMPKGLEDVVGIAAPEWRRRVSCAQRLHSATATHAVPGRERDQFHAFEDRTLAAVVRTEHTGGAARVVLAGGGNASGHVEVAYRAADASVVSVTVGGVALQPS